MKTKGFFDRVEDRIRGFLSHHPVLYALVAGVGLVLFWRGVWHMTDAISQYVINWESGCATTDLVFLLKVCSFEDPAFYFDGLISLVLGSLILLASGVFISELLGKEIIISGLRGEAKITEKTEVEVRTETGAIGDIRHEIRTILRRLQSIEKKLDEKNAPPAVASAKTQAKPEAKSK
jgi:hypothetical protein